MPWFSEFVAAAELARREIRVPPVRLIRSRSTSLHWTSAHADALETVWPGEIAIYDPRAGEIRGSS